MFRKYASAREAGNFAAGMMSIDTNIPTSIVDFGFGAYNMTGNSKLGTLSLSVATFGLTFTSPSLGLASGFLIGRYGEDKLSRHGINAGKSYKRGR